MSIPDALRGAEGQEKPAAADAKPSEAIRTGSSRDGVTTGGPRYGTAERSTSGEPVTAFPMKWVAAAVVLALMVFGITFVLNFFGASGKPSDTVVVVPRETKEQLKLNFVTTKLPPEVEGGDPSKQHPPLDVEYHKEGWADFWFENANDKAVQIGLLQTSCTCTGAQLYLLPPGSKMEPGNETLEKTATASPLAIPDEEGVKIAPKQVGWVRLKWSGESKKQSLSLKLWLNAKDVGPYPDLEARVLFHDAFKVEQASLPFPATSASKLPRTLPILCWSVTRPEFELTSEFLGGRKGSPEPLRVGKPEKLTEEECKDLGRRVMERTVAAAYRIPVTLRSQTEDGKMIDAGPFRRRLELSLVGKRTEPLTIEVLGEIQGDVQVGGLTMGRLDFSTFQARKGVEAQPLTLETLTADVQLEVDRERTAEFLEVDLHKQKAPATGGTTTWQLKIRVKPGEASGRFPRDNPAEYRDSAVYIRPVGVANARATRIPVFGSATTE